MTPSLIKAMTTADAVAAVLDANRLSDLLQRPVRAARLRIKPEVSVLVSLTHRSTGLTVGWARLLWPVSHSKAAQAERLAAADEELASVGAELSRARQQLGECLEQAVTAELEGLEMKGARLVVELDRLDEPGPTGLESVALLLVSHPGAPALPLGKGASGGELSRIMLALEVVLADAAALSHPSTHTLVFDEIDAGVGGRAAREIGRRLARLARHHQVIVVTHLAQVAAWADTHLVVRKETVTEPESRPGPSEADAGNVRKSQPGRTRTQVFVVEDQERQRELARMLSGHEDSQAAVRHAAELLQEAVMGQSEP